ncbi:MAG: helicase [Rhodospirillaceae bacterium]|nr:helicase [Rhodospirillaceae bacterium]
MTETHIDVGAVLANLKGFQQRTARWAFERMFADRNPAIRFLVADEVGLGKTHVAKGVIAQVIDHLRCTGDTRHDIVYVCSNAAIARQNIRKLAPEGVEPIEDIDRLTLLVLAKLDDRDAGEMGINLLAITPGTSLKFGRSTGWFRERCLAYTFLRAHWGRSVMTRPARRIFWHGVSAGNPDERLQWQERQFRPLIKGSLADFAKLLAESDKSRRGQRKPTVRAMFERLADGLAWQRKFPDDLQDQRKELIGEVRRIMAIVGIAALRPDLVVLDEFQRFKDLLRPAPENFAAKLAHRLFDYKDPKTGRATRTLLLSATPYRMYTTADQIDGDHYKDFFATCSFLLQDSTRVDRLQHCFNDLRTALLSRGSLSDAEVICADIGAQLRGVMARTERLAATPDRDGMLRESDIEVRVEPEDLRAYMRVGDLAEVVEHHEPTEYWKSGPYLINFMERYKLKETVVRAVECGRFAGGEGFHLGPGLLNWDDVEAYGRVDSQNGRLRWLLDNLEHHRAFELLWIPPSMRYYDAGSVYESPEATSFTKRLIFSGWAVVPKVVSSLVSYEAERRAFAARSHSYTADYRRRGGQRLVFRTSERTAGEARLGEAATGRRAAAMTAFLLTWPSPSLAELGDPRLQARGERRRVSEVLRDVAARVAEAIEPVARLAPAVGVVDQRWYWAAPLFLDKQRHPSALSLLLAQDGESHWEGDQAGHGLRAHLAEARAMAEHGPEALGRPPDDLVEVLAELAIGGPAQCALRMMSSVSGFPIAHDCTVANAAWVGAAFRSFFNAPEVTAVVVGADSEESEVDEHGGGYWRDVLRHSIDGNLQAVLDEHAHVLRDWLGHLNFVDDSRRRAAADDIALRVAEALELRTSSVRIDVPRQRRNGEGIEFHERRMRTRFAVAFGNQTLDDGGEARIEAVSKAFNSPFWPFVLVSTSIGQEGLDFHLWCHAVVHWNLPSNPVDLEQREGRVHRYKGHAVRRNIASVLGPELHRDPLSGGADPWSKLFSLAVARTSDAAGEMVPYWVFNQGPAKIERLVPVMPFSRDAAALRRLRRTLAAYRLAFGQPRQEELVAFLGANRSDADLLLLASKLRIDLSPP